MGDVEMWELICADRSTCRGGSRPTPPARAATAAARASSRSSMIWNTPFWELQNLGTTRSSTPRGCSAAIRAAAATCTTCTAPTCSSERAQATRCRRRLRGSGPARGRLRASASSSIDNFTTLHPFEEGDLYLSVMKGAAGLGDPAAAPGRGGRARRARRDTCCRASRSPCTGCRTATAFRRERLERARPVREWWAEQRERVLAQDVIEPVKCMYAESHAAVAALGGRVPRLLGPARGLRVGGRDTHGGSGQGDAREDHAGGGVHGVPRLVGGRTAATSCTAPARSSSRRWPTCSTRSSRGGRSRTSSRATRTPDRFDKWLAVLQERVPYDDPIVLPLRRGPEHRALRRATCVIRCDCGHDFCDHDATTGSSRPWCTCATATRPCARSTPRMAHADPAWNELREFYCPSCARQLEVEAVPPGYPAGARLPSRRGGLLRRLAGPRPALKEPPLKPNVHFVRL